MIKSCLVLPIYKGKLLLQLRSEGVYGLFGGHRLAGEQEKACACREFYEETGTKLSRIRLIPFYSTKSYKVFLTKIRSTLRPKLNTESKGFIWINISSLKTIKPLHKEFKTYISYITSKLSNQEDTMKQGVNVTRSEYKTILATLKKAGRTDLVKSISEDADYEAIQVSLDKRATEILNKKCDEVIEKIKLIIKKTADGPIEEDVLYKQVSKKLSEDLLPTKASEDIADISDDVDSNASNSPEDKDAGVEENGNEDNNNDQDTADLED